MSNEHSTSGTSTNRRSASSPAGGTRGSPGQAPPTAGSARSSAIAPASGARSASGSVRPAAPPQRQGSVAPRHASTPQRTTAARASADAEGRPHQHGAHDTDFRHSYSKDRAQLLRRLSRIEGQVRGIARMIERDEYCIDILQQTSALRAAVDAVAVMVLEDHVRGCVRTAAERGDADVYADEVLDVVRRTLGRPVRTPGRNA
jgi:DNA-binding FrmR family transcriptional regulator